MNPPPPPPHGEVPKGSGLPPGKYDIFIIPPHSAGSGFLYLPSLQPNVNSFAAGFATALILVALCQVLTPVVQAWWQGVKGSGGVGIIMIMVAIAVGAWALGRTQIDGGPGPGGGGTSGGTPQPDTHGTSAGAGGNAGFGGAPNGHAAGAGPAPGMSSGMPGGGMPGGERPKPTWQRTNTGAGTAGSNTANGSWEKAREETRKREEERKAREAERKRKEENERKLREAREKEARERESRERAQREAREAREKIEREVREKIERETRERLEKEREKEKEKEKEREKERDREREREKEKEKEKEKESETKVKSSTYAFSAVGEKTNPWQKGAPSAAGVRSQSSSPSKKPPPPPTAKTYLGTEDDAFSYRPYDKPRKPTHKKSQSSIYSESSYAASHTTAQTTPPPSQRGPYSTKDPDKIVIKAVYAFTNAFLKTPTSQLVSGVGSVTDGLILRITTEGLFIDDDVRGVPQREWDVKAWTLKLVEVWCPIFRQGPAGNSTSASARPSNPVRRLWSVEKDKAAVNEEADALLVEMLQACKDTCRLSPASAAAASLDGSSATGSPIKSSNRYRARQTGENKSAGLHVLRASIRDQEGRRYVFIITEEESWKVAVGLQRLRRGTQVRALGVSTMSTGDARTTLENLGWG
jgi:hypothetical protein